jgi:hypothetical protein
MNYQTKIGYNGETVVIMFVVMATDHFGWRMPRVKTFDMDEALSVAEEIEQEDGKAAKVQIFEEEIRRQKWEMKYGPYNKPWPLA